MNAIQFQECIRHLMCIGRTEFLMIFGDVMGAHLWFKFVEVLDHNVGKFIGELDFSNITLLFNYLESYLREIERIENETLLFDLNGGHNEEEN